MGDLYTPIFVFLGGFFVAHVSKDHLFHCLYVNFLYFAGIFFALMNEQYAMYYLGLGATHMCGWLLWELSNIFKKFK